MERGTGVADLALILFNYRQSVLPDFAKLMPHKRCGAGLINVDNTGRLIKVGSGCSKRAFLQRIDIKIQLGNSSRRIKGDYYRVAPKNREDFIHKSGDCKKQN